MVDLVVPHAPYSPSVLLSRRISFSVGLRLLHPDWDDVANQEAFGKKVGAHGCEFDLRLFLSGRIVPEDGMIVNLVEVKPILSRIIDELDGKFLDQDILYFRFHRPTAENVARYLWDALPDSVGEGDKHRITLIQSGGVRVELSQNSMKVCRSYEFAAAHRLFAPTLSEQENWQRFDKCSNPAGHGHNFGLQVWIEGKPDPNSGYVINPRLLDEIVAEEVFDRFDHKHLNEDCADLFHGRVPTSENLALVIFELLKRRLERQGYSLSRIGLQETQKNYFEVEAPETADAPNENFQL